LPRLARPSAVISKLTPLIGLTGRINKPLRAQVLLPLAAAAGEVLTMGNQPLVQVAGEQRDAVSPRVLAKEMAAHADLVTAAGEEHILIEPGHVFVRP